MAPLPEGAPTPAHLTLQLRNRPGGVHSGQEGADPSRQGRDNHGAEGRPCSTSHTPHQWDSGQDTQQHLYYKSSDTGVL